MSNRCAYVRLKKSFQTKLFSIQVLASIVSIAKALMEVFSKGTAVPLSCSKYPPRPFFFAGIGIDASRFGCVAYILAHM